MRDIRPATHTDIAAAVTRAKEVMQRYIRQAAALAPSPSLAARRGYPGTYTVRLAVAPIVVQTARRRVSSYPMSFDDQIR